MLELVLGQTVEFECSQVESGLPVIQEFLKSIHICRLFGSNRPRALQADYDKRALLMMFANGCGRPYRPGDFLETGTDYGT